MFNDLGGFLQDLVPEAIGITFTVLFIDALYRRREEERQQLELKEQLIRDAGTTANVAAKRAVDEIRKRGWLESEDGLLKRQDLAGANLQEAFLERANLQGTFLERANLQGALLQKANLEATNLWAANLQGANLWAADLHGAILGGANLCGADLSQANLQGAFLYHANLQGVRLEGANLQGMSYDDAQFSDQTMLPDGSPWTPQTDLRRFTDTNHPDFWDCKLNRTYPNGAGQPQPCD
jgi:hypothetical protein